jgi:putative DNA primase/helicase
MTTQKTSENRIVRLVAAAETIAELPPAPVGVEEAGEDRDEDGCDGPSATEAGSDHALTISEASRLDHSDTDNGRRLILHFGDDLKVMQRAGIRNTGYVVWTGTHWDLDGGEDRAFAVAQEIGALIGLEADHLSATPAEAKAIAEARTAADDLVALEARRSDWTDEERRRVRDLETAIALGKAAREALDKRKVARRKFAVSSKNKARLDAMLACAAPHLTRPPQAWNADPYRFATRTHTLRLVREIDPENPDPDGVRFLGTLAVMPGHRRDDLITFVVPVDFDPDAKAPAWDAFLERFLPSAAVRRFVQVFSGLGLLGVTVQKFVFHYGDGANGKSVFMQTLANVFGPLGANLEPESITGQNQRQGSQASPDIVKLFDKRFLKVSELPEGVPLQEELIKKLTGGEEMSARALFQGAFDFTPVFSAQMSGNGYPKIEGTNHGIWRRIAVVHWPVKIPESEQREFSEVIDGFRPEYPGILNWLIEGARIWLAEGLVLPEEVRAATKEYQDDMDPVGPFIADCVTMLPGHSVTAREMYEAYLAWAEANAVFPIKEAKFGRVMKSRIKRTDERIRRYLDCFLHDVPIRSPRNPDDERSGW